MKEPATAAKLLFLLWLIANPVLFFLVALSPTTSLAALLPSFVIELHETLLTYFTARSVY